MGKVTRPGAGSLLSHPNFSPPPKPATLGKSKPIAFERGVSWALEAAALFVSPPKVPGENEEFSCEDLAEAVRTTLHERLTGKPGKATPTRKGGKAVNVATRIYTDGACEPNPGPGAWGAYWKASDGEEIEMSGFDPETTNQRMEMMGPIVALETIKESGLILVLSDSQYVVKGITIWIKNWKRGGWKNAKGAPVKNRDLWERLDAAVTKRVGFQWVRGHAGDPGNERADFLARKCLLTTLENNGKAFGRAVHGFSRHHDFDPTPYLGGSVG